VLPFLYMERLGHPAARFATLVVLAGVILGPFTVVADEPAVETTLGETLPALGEALPTEPRSPVSTDSDAGTPAPQPLTDPAQALMAQEAFDTGLAAASLSGDTVPPEIYQSTFTIDELQYPAGSNHRRQTALKAGDTRYWLVLDVYDEGGAPTVMVDMSELGFPEPIALTVQANSVYASRYGAELFGDSYAIPALASEGLKTVRITITDPSGNTTFQTHAVYIDNVAPEVSFTDIDRTDDQPLMMGSTLLLSGTVDGTGTNTRFYYIWQHEYDAAGRVVREFGTQGMPGTNEIFSRGAGPIVGLPFVVQAQDGMSLHPDATSVSFSFFLVDESGNFATSSTPIIPLVGEILPIEPEVSNVLFLPGIKGSRLYGDSDGRLWIPGGDSDMRELFLDLVGKSTRDDIHVRVGDVLSEVSIPLVSKRFYQSFVEQMDTLQASGVIGDWEAVPYDWRLSLPDIINKGLETDGKVYYTKATSTPYIEQTLRELAASSKTGKVTIVAHSNGGLVAKALMQKLGNTETESLIDEVVFVGVPQAGAPQAVAALLYGYGENLPFSALPVMASASVSRALAENSPMAYHLLPSDKYFDQLSDDESAVTRFKGNTLYSEEIAAYGETIDSWEELSAFIQATEGGREKPHESDLHLANIGNADLLSYAEASHVELDSWAPPASIQLYQIAGWGEKTFTGIELREFSLPWFGTTAHDYMPLFNYGGDEVVPTSSALSISNSSNAYSYWIDLDKASDRLSAGYIHENLLEIDSVLGLISNILTQTDVPELTDDVYTSEPVLEDDTHWLRFFLHSPLTLEVFDANGNRVGLNEDGTVDLEIEGSEYEMFGEVQLITVPAGNEYRAELVGYDDGLFNLDIQELKGEEIQTQVTFAGIPTTPQTFAHISVPGSLSEDTFLSIDIDGNSEEDAVLAAQLNEEVIYAPSEPVDGNGSSGTGSGGLGSREGSSEVAGVMTPTQTKLLPDGSIQIQLSEKKESINIPKGIQGEVLGALDQAKTPDVVSVTTNSQPMHWLNTLASWVYTFIEGVFQKISLFLTFAYAR